MGSDNKINKNDHIKLIYSSNTHCSLKSNLTKELCPSLGLQDFTQRGHECNDIHCLFNLAQENNWLKDLQLKDVPPFLKSDLTSGNSKILLCQNLTIDSCNLTLGNQELKDIFCLKFMIRRLEKLYSYSEHRSAQGILFVLKDSYVELLIPFEELFSYIAPHMDKYGERSYWYLPTRQSAYDDFIELSEDINLKLEQYLWREQKYNQELRRFIQNFKNIVSLSE